MPQEPPAPEEASSENRPSEGEEPSEEEALELSLSELRRRIQAFLDDYLDGKSDETVGTYERSLNGFQKWFVQQQGRFRFREDDVRAYKQYLAEERGLSQATVSTYLTALRRLCQYLVDAGLLEENPATGVKGNRRPESHSRAILTEQDIADSREHTLLPRLGTPEDIGDTAVFLASDEASFITGASIPVDGGWLAHSGL